MKNVNVYEILRRKRILYDKHIQKDSSIIKSLQRDIDDGIYDFSKFKFNKINGHTVALYEPLSSEYIILDEMSRRLKKEFVIKMPNRNQIIMTLFDNLCAVSTMRDFTIARFDLKRFYYSIESMQIYDDYIKSSCLSREDKKIIQDICASHKYCIGGVSIFNHMIEIISKVFDTVIRGKLKDCGIIFYSRYVDDIFIIFNRYVDDGQISSILQESLKEVFNFHKNGTNVKVNNDKTKIIHKRDILEQSVDFLGYEFFFGKDKDIKIGMSKSKRAKYQEKVNRLVKQYRNDPILLRRILKAHCSRIVYRSATKNPDKTGRWICKGIVANYKLLGLNAKNIHADTTTFLQQIYFNAFRNNHINAPVYLSKSNRYSLYNGIIENRAMIFDELIGMQRRQLLKECQKINITTRHNSSYDYLVRQYLIKTKVGY